MSKTLVIVESPAKAKTIAKFLGKNYTVKASMGHVRDLPKSQFGVDVEHDFEPKYITIRGKGDILKELRSAAKKAKKVYLATDPDREGEAIAWHLQYILGLSGEQASRIEFNEITEPAIKKAVKNPRKIEFSRVAAQQTRRILDRLVGYNLSPLLWRKIRKGLSAGRVQSVAVKLICDREEEIEEFIPEEYWTLETILFNNANHRLHCKLLHINGEKLEIPSKVAMDQVMDQLKGITYKVKDVVRREKRRNPAPPFTTSSMQQEAYRKLGFAARKTMLLAQQLYEGLDVGEQGTVGLVTYIRTDSTRIAETASEQARELIEDKYGKEYYPPEPRQYTTKGRSQGAHEAIRPTYLDLDPEKVKDNVSRDQYRLYKLIWDRFVASQMASAILDQTRVDITAGVFTFRASGSQIKFPGFMKVYIASEEQELGEKDLLLPDLTVGEELKPEELLPQQHFTQPPARYTDASLIKTLEEEGIGRPSTYAPIVETIQKRGYVSKEEKQFFPTELGVLVIDLLETYFPDIIDIEFTASLEDELDRVEEGSVDWVEVLKEFYPPFHETLEKADEAIPKVKLADPVSDELCPECGTNLVIKLGRFGRFLACPRFPDCRYTKPLLEATGVHCPHCQGEMVLRRSKKGRKFYGCSNYPACDFVTWEQPTNQTCPTCGEMLVQKTNRKGTVLKCSKKGCGYHEIVAKEATE
ncbi:MAG TPA: type I DNA topoisomerase [Bacillota bacterium]|nr:type I DNA topoisomerase [Bacillota bacterium]